MGENNFMGNTDDIFYYIPNHGKLIIFVRKVDNGHNALSFTGETYDYFTNKLSLDYDTDIPDYDVWASLTDQKLVEKYYLEYLNFIMDSFGDDNIINGSSMEFPIVLNTIKKTDDFMVYEKHRFKYSLNKDGYVDIQVPENIFKKYLDKYFYVILSILIVLFVGLLVLFIYIKKRSPFGNNSSINHVRY